jgi:hypothetical protein
MAVHTGKHVFLVWFPICTTLQFSLVELDPYVEVRSREGQFLDA